MLKRAIIIAIFLTSITALLASSAHAAGFLDFPHKYNGCNNCHLGTNPGEPSMLPAFNCTTIDDTQHNNLCESCHEGVTAPLMKTHSSIRFGTKYGNWSVECVTCHFPHKQMQFLEYGIETYLYPPASPLPGEGVSDNIEQPDIPNPGESQLTDDEASWTPDEFQNRILIANINDSSTGFEGLGYRIKSNTATQLILDGNIDTVRAPVGSDFAIIYGDLVKETVPLDNVIVYCGQSTQKNTNTLTESGAGWTPDEFVGDTLIPNLVYANYRYTIQSNTPTTITTVGPMNLDRIEEGRDFKIVRSVTGSNPVKFFNNNGTNSFADGDATYDGICEVCHTLTDHFRNDGSGPDQTHTSQGPSIPGINCTTCHFHNDGFAPEDCSRCHGFPPIEDVLNSASTGGNTGLTDDPGVTGSVTAGEHESHVNTFGYNDCNYCHNNSASKDDPTHNSGLEITLGFSQFSGAQQGGDYHGQTTVTYNYTATVPATSGSSNGTLTCDNLYCHSDVQGQADGTGLPTLYGQPVWNNAGSVQCGNCHKADGLQGDATLMDSGTHTEHVGTDYNYSCEKCHEGKGAGSPTTHVNNDIDMVFDAWNTGASYSQSPNAAGNGYGTCSTAYCHSDGQSSPVTYAVPTWGITLPADCTGCHGNDAAAAPNTMNTGAHFTHVNDTDQEVGKSLQCEVCHEVTVSGNRTIINYANHVNTTRDVDINITGETDCTNIQCHSDGNLESGASTVYNNPSWNPPATLGCVDCHGDGNTKAYPSYADGNAGSDDSNSHNAHVGIACGQCHNETSTAGTTIDGNTPTYHVNQTPDIDFSQGGTYTDGLGNETCSSTYCHGVDTPQWGSSLPDPAECDSCHGGNAQANATAGLGPMASNEHPDHMNQAGILGTDYPCAQCHDDTVDINNDRVITGPSFHSNGTKDVNFNLGGSWNGVNTCTNLYCHSSGKGTFENPPLWGSGSPLDCKGCHGTTSTYGEPDYPNGGAGQPDANSHTAKHIGAAADCNNCHTDTTTTGTEIKLGSTLHTNQALDVTIASNLDGNGGASNYDGSKNCSSVYCHSTGQSTIDGNDPVPTYDTPQWGDPAYGCNTCHPNTEAAGLTSGSHDEHLNQNGVNGCSDCHVGAANDGSSYSTAEHVDKTIDVDPANTYSKGSSAPPGDGYGNCSTAVCHGDGSPQWGIAGWGAAIDTCTKCHGTPSAPTAADYLRAPPVDTARNTGSDVSFVNTDAEIGAHQTHLRASDLTQTVSNGLSPDVSCDECHPVPVTVDAANHLGATPAELNGFWGTLATTNSTTPNWDSGLRECSNVYCHGGAMPRGDDSG
ncbi:MAG: CxxxxCH/CxxCH domain c-type cytochrome, partial [Planctomycetota bacterium]